VTLLVASRLAGRRDRRFRPTDREFRIVLASSHRLDARLGDDATTTRALEEDVEDARERRRVQRRCRSIVGESRVSSERRETRTREVGARANRIPRGGVGADVGARMGMGEG